MRKLYAGFFLFCIFNFIVSTASANTGNDSDLNARLRNLQQRLQTFHSQTAQKFISLTDAVIDEDIAKIVEPNDELFAEFSEIEELDANKGAALTILFHDWEFFENQKLPEVNNNEKTSESKININEIKEADNVGNFFKINYETAKMPSGAAIKRPANNRMLKLEELRKKIILACSR